MKKQEMINEISVLLAFTVLDFGAVLAADKIRLSDIMVLTLYDGRMTNARRSVPIPQLKCIGGSAGCSSYVPQVVQCYNRGSDGYDVQWECKTDMDNAFRFGRVEVSCEGHDFPDDPYVLRGSCGCEYTLDLTQEGHQKRKHRKQHQHNYYGDDEYDHDSYSNDGYSSYTSYQKGASTIGDIIMLIIIGIIIYAIYRTCLGNNDGEYAGYGSMDNDSDDRPSGGYNRRGFYGGGGGGSPPPPGFRPGYTPGGGGCGGAPGHGTTGTGGGGFWTGAATGGILGYLLGNTGRRGYGGYGHGYARPYSSWGSGWGSGFGSGFGRTGFGGGSSSSSSYSSGTRSASGFGGTRRR